MKKLVLIDGNALLHRAFHATPPFTTSKGELVNAVYGFTAMIFKVINDLKPDYLAVTWDEKGPTFRHQEYTQYKATRGVMDESLSGQYKRVFEVNSALNIPEFSVAGYEADDLIGTLALQAVKEKNLEVVIATGDRDIMQLIGSKVKVLMPKKTILDVGLYGEEEFVLKYGFEPKKLIDYKGLAGDASDNIPGVNGIGDVSATKLIHEFGTVENIYKPKNIKTLPERLQKLLAEGAEQAVMSKKLATLNTKAPIKLDLQACIAHDFDQGKVLALLQELEFKSLIPRIPGASVILNASEGSQDLKSTRPSFGSRDSSPSVQNDKGKNATDLDLQVQPVLEKMSKSGVLVDTKFLSKFGKELKARLGKIEKEIYSKIGHQFNLNSPKQLQIVLFDELKLPVVRKTKTGRSTDEDTLQELKLSHPAVELLLEYRQLFKLVSTYIDTLPKYVAEDGRVHSTFNVEGAATGRLSSKDPNLQNIPIKGEKGAELRKAFVAPKGKVLLGADYSQVELRILAHVTADPALKKAFEKGEDIHQATAAKIFNVSLDEVTKTQRLVGKTMNFATLYGQGPHALSRQLGIDFATARTYIEEYFAQFPKVKEWMGEVLAFGYEKGYVETLLGRRRYIPELASSSHMIKSAGERAAVNHPIQGTSADMIKRAMVDIARELTMDNGQWKIKNRNSQFSIVNCQLILQVHDELLFECNENSVIELAKMVKDKMENAIKLSVPVVVDLKTGPNWGEMQPIKV